MNCMFCKEVYTDDDIEEWMEMREKFYRDRRCFICPDCYDAFKRRDLEEQLEVLMRNGIS